MRRLALVLLGALAGACLVQRPPSEAPAAVATPETRASAFPDGSKRSETSVLVWPDGRVERHGREREYHPNGQLRSEGSFTHDRPTGVWRTWYADGRPRSEVDFGTPGASTSGHDRFWHENGRLAAEGPSVGGVRSGRWSFWRESGLLAREGSFRAGLRDGRWTFYDEQGSRRAQGDYDAGVRVGAWTLWDADGTAHERPAAAAELERALADQ